MIYGNNISTSFYVIFNGCTNMDLGVRCIKRPNIPSPEKNIEEIYIEGREESLTIDKGGYKNITISVPFDFVDRDTFQETSRKIKRWVNNIKDNHLKMSDDTGVFYKVKSATTNIERNLNVGSFTIDFVCSPYTWLEDGQETLVMSDLDNIYHDYVIQNYYEIAKPIYTIKANGLVTFTVNGKVVTINVGQEITIDTQLEKCFKNNQMINLALITGTFEDLYLREGENVIGWHVGTGGTITDVTMIPNWKTV